MPEKRRSSRVAGASPSPVSSPAKAGSKRKANASPNEKKSKKSQKTLEETMPDSNNTPQDDVEMKDDNEVEDASKTGTNGAVTDAELKSEGRPKPEMNGSEKEAEHGKDDAPETTRNGVDRKSKDALDANTGESDKPIEAESIDSETGGYTKNESAKSPNEKPVKLAADAKSESNGDFVEDKNARDDKIASNIIEKGIIYFFTRGRVNVEGPEGVQDLQRTYFVLRPVPIGAKLGKGAIDDSNRNRLLALPKKVFPKSGKDRFMAFVEKSRVSMSELKEEFFQGNEYKTRAGDSRHTPPVAPIGEGVYAITETGRSSHLVYMLTIPKEPGKLQDDLGIHTKGSFTLSLKNPKNKGPANTQLPKVPEFPEEIMNAFGGLAWMPVKKSEYLDYPNAQLLLIGEGQKKFSNAVGGVDGKGSNPEEELEKFEDEDQIRVEALNGEDAVFADLHISKDEYSDVTTTW